MTDPDLREPEPAHPPAQLWQPWTLIVPTILLLPMLSLAFSWQISPSDDADLRRASYHYPRGAEMPEAEPSPTPEAEPKLTPDAAPKAAPVETAAAISQLTYFVPNDDGVLQAKTFSTTGGAANFSALGTAALKALFPDAPDYFPAGTALQSLQQDQADPTQVKASFNNKFWQSAFWAGETRADMAMQAIGHTLEAAYHQTGGNGPLHIQLLSDGHTKTLLGSFEVDKPYTPDPTLIAGKSSHSASVTKP